MRKLLLLFSLVSLCRAADAPCTTAQACWDLLKQGNDNWAKKGAKLLHPNQTPDRRTAVSEHQSPFAVVLSCSDSRVPPEVIFDRGVGDLFVIRVAGNVLDRHAMGSIQYAVEVKKYAKLIVVLGHQRCGAAEAAVQQPKLPEPLATLISALRPAVDASKRWPGDPVENAVDANIHLMTKQLADTFSTGGVMVVGKRYSLDTGEVSDPQRWK